MPPSPSSIPTQRITHHIHVSSAAAAGGIVRPCSAAQSQLQQYNEKRSSSVRIGSGGDGSDRQRPAYEKLIIGPIMVFGEMITGGHYLEVLRLGKQMTIGHDACPSYLSLHRCCVNETGSWLSAFYRGFFPWGLVQCLKGVPVLFVQHESMHRLQTLGGMSVSSSEKVSGFLGGAVQAIFVCPMQKIKVSVVASPVMNALSPYDASKNVIRKHGLASLYHGLLPMMLRRSLDWGIRFTVSSEVKSYLLERKKQRSGGNMDDTKLAIHELIGCGLVGGAFSALTHPIDNIITNSQKPMPRGTAVDMVSVMKRMVKESGTKAFTRGFAIKIVDNAYHMAWMYGVGTIAYDYIRTSIAETPR